MMYKPADVQNPLKAEEVPWSVALKHYMNLPDSKVPQKVRQLVVGEVDAEDSNEACTISDYETSEDEEIDLNFQPDFVLAGYNRQPTQDDAAPQPKDPHAYWRSLPEELTLDAHRFVVTKRDTVTVEFSTDADPERLNTQQRRAYDMIVHNLMKDIPIHMFINGTAGSGKSYLIMCLRKYVETHFSSSSIEVCAPTGTAAFNISGRTIHSAMSLPVPLPPNSLVELKGEALLAFQQRLESVKLIIIDEMSMIGRVMLRCIDLRLREAHPHNRDRPFGGISVCLFGDFGQLPPVMDKPIFDISLSKSALSNDGRQSFKAFNKAIILTRVERVQGDDEEQTFFRELLLRFRNGLISDADGNKLSERLAARLGPREIALFKDAPYLVATRNEETAVNDIELSANKNPVFKIKAVHKPIAANKAILSDAMGLEAEVKFAKGSKVMLRSNLWVSAGLTNGSLGTVHDILYEPDSSALPPALPVAVCVDFVGYLGPPWDSNHPKVVPIAPITAKWLHGGKTYSRTQIPLSLAHAVTIHKSQGWTKERIKVDIGSREYFPGLSFVAFSRAKSFKGLLIVPMKPNTFHHERLQKVNNKKVQENRKYVDSYMAKLASHT